METHPLIPLIAFFLGGASFAQDALQSPGGDDAAELAKKLANPIASLISVPIQANYDDGYGPTGGGSVWRTNIQPVIPF
jgi:hypothetical protein